MRFSQNLLFFDNIYLLTQFIQIGIMQMQLVIKEMDIKFYKKGGKSMTDKQRDELLINISNDMNNIKNDMNNIKNDMKEIKKEQRNLSRTVAKIEVEHGEKLQILLDVVAGQEEKNKQF